MLNIMKEIVYQLRTLTAVAMLMLYMLLQVKVNVHLKP